MPPKYVEYLANHHASSQGKSANVLTLPACGHLAMLEYTATVTDFIRGILTDGK